MKGMKRNLTQRKREVTGGFSSFLYSAAPPFRNTAITNLGVQMQDGVSISFK